MDSVSSRIATGLRSSIYGFAVVATVLAIGMDNADARARRKRAVARESYNPPYASIVVDANSGRVLQETNADSLRHPASLTKIMTLYLLFERLEAGKIKLGSVMTASAHAAAQAPTKLGLKPGAPLKVEDAIRALVTKSANDAAVVIAETLAGDEDDFATLMTRKARALGMSRTVYRNASGLPDGEQVTTARDQAILGRAIQERFPRYYTYFSTPSFTYNGATIRNHNRLIGQVEGVDGIKTGYTNASGFNLVTSMRRNGKHIVAVVLGGRSAGARDARMRALVTEKIAEASSKRTAPMIAEASDAAPAPTAPAAKAAATPAAKFSVASAATVPVPTPAASEQAAVAAASQPTAARPPLGSAEPIKPIPVKTIKVKLSGTQTAALAPAIPMQPADEPTHAVASAAAAPVINPRPGVLGVLPAVVAPARAEAAEHAQPAKTAAVATQKADAKPETKSDPSARSHHSGWMVQVGAFPAEDEAKQRLSSAQSKAKSLLGHADAFTETITKGDKTLYRARFAGLDREQAEAVCKHLKRNDIACMAIKN
jgi:D-alanyl-D-alanine carboxypeptidase